jgi:hypothetical protein
MKKLLAFALAAVLAGSVQAQVEHTGLGSCIDNPGAPDQVDYSDTIQWSSDIQGPLGTGATITPVLNVGTHLVTATCADVAGNGQSAVVEVTVAETDTTPPTLTITVEPTVAQAGIGVTSENPIIGNFSLELTRGIGGRASYVEKTEGVSSPSGHVVEDWGTSIEAGITIDHQEAVLLDGFELVVMRGADPANEPIWDLILVGTSSQPLALARVHTLPEPQDTQPIVLTQDSNAFFVTWRQGAGDGLLRLRTGMETTEILGLNIDREMFRFQVGGPESTDGLAGRLLFDTIQVFAL